MRISNDTYLDYCDVLISPQRSSLDSRKEVHLRRAFTFKHTPMYQLECTPIIAANMDTTGSIKMSFALESQNCLTALSKHLSNTDYCRGLRTHTFYTIGTSDGDLEKLRNLLEDGIEPTMICIDVANGYTKHFTDFVSKIREIANLAIIMAGNVVTPNMVEELLLVGADIVKVGIGSGANCLTRVVTGVGIPQLSAIDECAFAAHGLGGYICADGGITCSGDVCKALCAGADFVMIGGMFAGTEECDGVWDIKDGVRYLRHYGSASKEAQELHNGGLADYRASEGKEVLIPYKGSVIDIIKSIKGGIASCCTYIGASKIKDMPKCASFVRVNRTHNTIFGDSNAKL